MLSVVLVPICYLSYLCQVFALRTYGSFSVDVGRRRRDEYMALDPRFRGATPTRALPPTTGAQRDGRGGTSDSRLDSITTNNSRLDRTPHHLHIDTEQWTMCKHSWHCCDDTAGIPNLRKIHFLWIFITYFN